MIAVTEYCIQLIAGITYKNAEIMRYYEEIMRTQEEEIDTDC